jgi:hypothetical protein
VIAANTNHWDYEPATNVNTSQTCSGGYQVYCCQGFKASTIANTNSLSLIGRSSSSIVSKQSAEALVSDSEAAISCQGIGSTLESGKRPLTEALVYDG